MKFFKGHFSCGGLFFTALLDREGRLWHLNFKAFPEASFLRRLKRHFSSVEFTAAPASLLASLEKEIASYLTGRNKVPNFPYVLLGTPFERQVWQAVSQVPYGEVRSYGWLARTIGRPRAYRAVGQALARNPVPILVPCHRIVGTRGLTGFSQGLAIKRRLLQLEGALSQ